MSITNAKVSIWRNSFLVLLNCIFLFSLNCSAEERDPNDTRPRSIELAESFSGVEYVDPRNGNLTIRHKELFIPGSGGMDITVWRSYDLNQMSAGLLSTHNQSFRWTALGPGWTLGVAPLLYFENRYQIVNSSYSYFEPPVLELCRTNKYLGDAKSTYLVLPEGNRVSFYGDGGSAIYTKTGWKLTCDNGIVELYSPDGIVYDYGPINLNRKIGREAVSPRDIGYVTQGHPALIRLVTRSVSFLVAISAKDRKGNTLAYEYKNFGELIEPWPLPGNYNGSGNLTERPIDADSIEKPSVLMTRVISNDGREVNFNYHDDNGRLLSMSDNSGRTWTYEHLEPDSSNSRTLIKVNLPTGISWQYAYAPGAFLHTRNLSSLSPIDPLNTDTATSRKLISLTYPTGGQVNFSYEYFHFSLNAKNGQFMSAGERVKKRTYPATNSWWEYSYTRGGENDYDTTVVNGQEGYTTYKFVGAGHKIWTGGYPYSFQNNAWQIGQIVEKKHPTGTVEKYEYQPRLLANTIVQADELGTVWDEKLWAADLHSKTITRDGALHETVYSNYDRFGNPGMIVERGPNGGNRTTNKTYFKSDNTWIIGRLKNEISESSNIEREFDTDGQLISLKNNDTITSYTYDQRGNLNTKTSPRGYIYKYSNYQLGIPTIENQPEGITITRTVDAVGNITSETNGENYKTTFSYDELNRIKSIVYPIGSPKIIEYTPNSKTASRGDLVELTEYDEFGRPVNITLGGITTSYFYDYLGRKIRETNPGDTAGKNKFYDSEGRVTSESNQVWAKKLHTYSAGAKTIVDENGNATTYTFRSYGDPNEQYLLAILAPEITASVTFTRDARNLVRSVTQAGHTRTYNYNSNNHLISANNPETGETIYGRDAEGNMMSRKVGSSSIATYSYDGQNRMIATKYLGDGLTKTYLYNNINKLKAAESTSSNRKFDYDGNGNLKTDTLEIDGRLFSIKYTYNENDQLSSLSYPQSSIIINYAPDVLGRPTQVSGYLNAISYWPSGMLKRMAYNNGRVSIYDQDPRLLPTRFAVQDDGARNNYLMHDYKYNSAGNLTAIHDAHYVYFREMEYDKINRLVGITGPSGTGNFSYDGTGNLRSQTLGNYQISYQYNESNKLDSVSGSRSTQFRYDAYGNTINAWGRHYTYDNVPNLICVDCDTQNKIQYSYDPLNMRTSVTKAGHKTYEMYSANGNLLMEFTPTQGGRLVEHIYVGDKRVAERVTP
jgi:YD repeat-containing protein